MTSTRSDIAYSSLISRIKSNDCRYQTIDLSSYELNVDNLEDLKSSLALNNVVGRVIWGDKVSSLDCKDLVRDIEENILLNVKNYKLYPTPLEYGLLSDDVYKESEVSGVDGWEIVQFDTNTNTGFAAKLYKHLKYCQMVLSYRGSESNLYDFIGGDWQIDINTILLNQDLFKGQVEGLYSTSKEAVKIAKAGGYSLSFTGHSLGGWLASLNLYFADREDILTMSKSVTFDAPGISLAVTNIKYSDIKSPHKYDARYLDINNYVSYPNFVNIAHIQIGKVYFVRTNLLHDQDNDDLLSFVKGIFGGYYDSFYTLMGHKLGEKIIPVFNKETGILERGSGCKAKEVWPAIIRESSYIPYKDYRTQHNHDLKDYERTLQKKIEKLVNNYFKQDIEKWISDNAEIFRSKCLDTFPETTYLQSFVIDKAAVCENLPQNIQNIIIGHADLLSKILMSRNVNEIWDVLLKLGQLALGIGDMKFWVVKKNKATELQEKKELLESYAKEVNKLVEEGVIPLRKTLHYVLFNVVIGLIEEDISYSKFLEQYFTTTKNIFEFLAKGCPSRKESTSLDLYLRGLDLEDIDHQKIIINTDKKGNYPDKFLKRIKNDRLFKEDFEEQIQNNVAWLKDLYKIENIENMEELVVLGERYRADHIVEYAKRIVDLYPEIGDTLESLYYRGLSMVDKLDYIKEILIKVKKVEEYSKEFDPNNILHESRNSKLKKQVEELINDSEVKKYFANDPNVSELLSYLWLQYSIVNHYMWRHNHERIKEILLGMKEDIKKYVINTDERLQDLEAELDKDEVLMREIKDDEMKVLLIKVNYSLARSYFYLKHNQSNEKLVEIREESKKYLESIPVLAKQAMIEGGNSLEDLFEVHLSKANALYRILKEEAEDLIREGKGSESIEVLNHIIKLYIERINDNKKYKLDYNHEGNYKLIVPSENEYVLAECYEQVAKCYLDLAIATYEGSKSYYTNAVATITGGEMGEYISHGVLLSKVPLKKAASVLNTLGKVLFEGSSVLDYVEVKNKVLAWQEKYDRELNKKLDIENISSVIDMAKEIAYIAKGMSGFYDHTRAEACDLISEIAEKQSQEALNVQEGDRQQDSVLDEEWPKGLQEEISSNKEESARIKDRLYPKVQEREDMIKNNETKDEGINVHEIKKDNTPKQENKEPAEARGGVETDIDEYRKKDGFVDNIESDIVKEDEQNEVEDLDSEYQVEVDSVGLSGQGAHDHEEL